MDIAEKTYKSLRVTEERKQKIRSLLLASGFSFCMSGLFGQSQIYPVSVSTQLIPPYSVNLADYAAPGCEQLKVIIVQRDLTQAPYMIYLKMQIELNGRVIIRSSPDYIPPAITLEPGIPQVISGTILSQYLDPQNMLFEGYSRESYIRTKLLPEGAYAITFTAYDWTRRDVALSRGGSSFSYLAKTGPPMLNLPFNNAMIPGLSPQNINFHWIPGNASSPNSAFTTKYLFELFEMRVGGINPAEVVRNSRPIYTEETSNTSIAYSIDKPVLEAGIRYVWRVKAFDTQGRDLIRNNGFSEVFSFIYGEDGSNDGGIIDFAEIENFKAQAISPRRAMLIWDQDPVYDRYKIYYRKQGRENKWYESETVDGKAEINGLTPGQTYECRVQGRRKNIWGEFSITDTVLLPLIPVIECGSAFKQNIINNRTPLADLMKFQEFDAGGFMVTVLDSVMRAAGPGRFSGNGFVQVPLFSHKKIKCRFDNILINTDFQMIEGSVRLITDWKNNALTNLDDIFEGGKNNGEVKEGTDQASIKVETVVENADDIVLDTASKQLLITTGSGEVIQVDAADKLANNPGTITLQDADGNMYSVDTSTGKATSIGKAPSTGSNGISSMPTVIDTSIGIVTFDSIPGATRFSLDKWNPGYYNKSNIFKGKYTFMEMAGGGLYEVAFKLIPAGESDVVLASFNMKNAKYADSIMFVSGTGSKYTAKATGDGKYILTLPSGNPNDGIDIFATCRTGNGKTSVLGKIIVMTYSMQLPKLILVPVNGNGVNIDPAVIKSELDKVYKPVAVDWQVSRTDNFDDSTVVNNLDVTGSGLFSQYTDGMKQLNNDFIKSKGKNFDQNAIYLFLLQHSSTDENEGMTGDMPRNKQFGYIFTKTALKGGDAALYRTIAHEIAHGAFHLKHTFDSEYQIAEKTTNNLLDYTDGIDLIKPQWDAIHDPGLVLGLFEKDEDGAMSLPCLGWFDDCVDVLKTLENFRNARIKGNNIKLKGQTKADEQTLTGRSVSVGGKDYSRIRIIYKPEDDDYTFDPLKYIDYDQSFISKDGTDVQTGIAYLNQDNKEFFKILVDESDMIENLKEYLFGSGISIEVESNGKRINENSFVTISAIPEMPEIKVKNTSASDIIFRLRIEYRRDIRTDDEYFPGSEWEKIKPGETWKVDFGDKIRGGKATLLYKTGNKEFSFVFHIRGLNPTESEVKNYLTLQGYNIWFLTRMIRHESSYHQFNEGTNYGPEWSNSQGCPNLGPPHGWGLMQLDIIGGTRSNPLRPSAQQLWDWKSNIRGGVEFLLGEKHIIAENNLSSANTIISTWNRPGVSFITKSPTTDGGITYTHSISSSFNHEINSHFGNLPVDPNKSYIDACWIKTYNGVGPHHYYYLLQEDNKTIPHWEICDYSTWTDKNGVIHKNYYVKDVGNRTQ
jgi:hypothetical protein